MIIVVPARSKAHRTHAYARPQERRVEILSDVERWTSQWEVETM